jgi:hypothetical protein
VGAGDPTLTVVSIDATNSKIRYTAGSYMPTGGSTTVIRNIEVTQWNLVNEFTDKITIVNNIKVFKCMPQSSALQD